MQNVSSKPPLKYPNLKLSRGNEGAASRNRLIKQSLKHPFKAEMMCGGETFNLLSAELTCGKTEMVLVLPVTSFPNVNLTELQLNSPTCPISYNSTHLTASISLDGCGTKTVVTRKI